jgi:hypothetical protein
MPKPIQLGYHSNNLYENFPPLMNDGRTVIAGYQPDAIANEQLIKENNIQTNWEYRQYLQTNAKEIMRKNCMSMSNDIGYVCRYEMESVGNTPQMFARLNDRPKNMPTGYSDSDLKRMYLTREELNARTNAATQPIDQAEVLKYR